MSGFPRDGREIRRLLLYLASPLVFLPMFIISYCKNDQPSQTVAATAKGAVVARVGEIEITESNLDSKISSQVEELERRLFEIKAQALGRLIDEKILEAEAKKRGLEPAVFLRDEVTKRLPEPTDEEIEERLSKPPFSTQLEAMVRAAKDDEEKAKRKDAFKAQVRVQVRKEGEDVARSEFISSLRKSVKVETELQAPDFKRADLKAGEGPSQGPKDASITLISFADFQCPSCRAASSTVKSLLELYPSLRYEYRSFPLPMHPKARRMAEAGYCAFEAGKFWEISDLLYSLSNPDDSQLKEAATKVGLDPKAFEECLNSGRASKKVDEDLAEGKRVQVSATPTFFINGIKVQGAKGLDFFRVIVDSELRKSKG